MKPEDAVQSVLDYHRKTNHSVESVRAGNISLDFSILPRLYKLYRRAEALPLPEESAPSNVPALEAIAGDAPTRDGAPTLEDVAALLKLSAGITKWLKVPNGSMAFRAASCTGALYHIELYLVCGDLPGLPAGVYQYGAQDNALRRVRSGDYRGALVAATAGHPEVASAPVSVVYTSVFWRNAWKYQSRAYRHAYWDCGTVLANTLSVASSRGLPTQVVTGFADDAVNRVVDVDGVREAAVAIVPVGSGGTPVAPTPAPERVNLETLPYSPKEIDYPLIRATHDATSLGRGGRRCVAGPRGERASDVECAADCGGGGRFRRAGDRPSRVLAAVSTGAHRRRGPSLDAGRRHAAGAGRLALTRRGPCQRSVPHRERRRWAGAGRVRLPRGRRRA